MRIPYMHRGQERVAPPRRTKPSNEGIGSRAEGNHEGAAGLCLWALGGVLWAWGCGLRVIGSAFWALGLRLWAQAKERMWTLCQKIAQERQQANRAKRNIKTQRACACVRAFVCLCACMCVCVCASSCGRTESQQGKRTPQQRCREELGPLLWDL